MFGKKPKSPDRPATCHRCGRLCVAEYRGRWLCLEHYRQDTELAGQQVGFEHHMMPVHHQMNAIVKAHPEWERKDDETKSAYHRRMMRVAIRLQIRLNELVKDG